MTALDATFLELEEVDDSAHMHIGGVLVFDPRPGAPGARRSRSSARASPRGSATCPASATGSPSRRPAACTGRTGSPTSSSTSSATSGRRAARPGRRGGAARLGGRVLLRAPDAEPPALGDRQPRARRRRLGAGQQDAPLHGRRRRLHRHRPDDPRRRAGAGAEATCRAPDAGPPARAVLTRRTARAAALPMPARVVMRRGRARRSAPHRAGVGLARPAADTILHPRELGERRAAGRGGDRAADQERAGRGAGDHASTSRSAPPASWP